MHRKLNLGMLSVLLLISIMFVYDFGYTHSGRTDSKGGHYNRKTGQYHYHGGAKPRPQVNPIPTAPRISDNAEVVVTNPTVTQGVVGKVSRRSELKLAAWNIRILSDNSRDDAELQKIAQTLIGYDFIAITELRDEKVLKRLQKILSESGAEYGYLMSEPVGREGSPHKERYAFLYYKGLVSVVEGGELYPDAADGKDDFVRDPYWATFRAGKFDFSVVAVHVVWGDAVADRRAEVMELAEVYSYVQKANGAEDDVLLVGDFNREPDDTVAYSNLMVLPSMTHLFRLPQKSHIRDSSLYDNIFFQTDYVTEYLGRSGIDKFDETDFGNDDKAANLAVSDHRPVWAVFSIDGASSSSTPTPSPNVGGQEVIISVPKLPAVNETSRTVAVYVTQTGKKYHRGSCSYLRRSKILISLEEAKLRYSPCSLCGPPQSLLNEELKELPATNPNPRLDRAWLNRVYPNAKKVSTAEVSTENQTTVEAETTVETLLEPNLNLRLDIPSISKIYPPKSNPNLRLDRAWLNRIYPNAKKVSTAEVSTENQNSSKPKVSSSKYPACKVCGGGSVVTKYGKKSHSSTCRYVTNTKYPTRSTSSYSSGRVRVRGYYRKDGTYVRPHTRRKPSR